MISIVSGTGTDVGKTIATAALATTLPGEVHVIKPAQTGEEPGRGDLTTIHRLTGLPWDRLHEFARFPDPLAPLTAARHAGMHPLQFDATLSNIRALDGPGRTLLIEGAGGLLVQLGLDSSGRPWTIADLALALRAPVFVVTATSLGCLNHVALTLEALATRGLQCAGLIGGSVAPEPDLATRLNLEEFAEMAEWLGALPDGAGALSRRDFLTLARQHLRP